ncbi:sigma-70 family RNA polymerase sigma factor [bacterium]|nr:sigma-70 family RNA polymerase sigma factor [bacterium]
MPKPYHGRSMTMDKETLIGLYFGQGDTTVKDDLIRAYMPLVEYIARKLAFNRDDIDDLIQIGTFGLLRSIDRFELAKSVDFATFATPNIIGEIKHYFRDKRGILKVPRKLQEQYSRIKRYIKETQLDGVSPTIPQIALALGLSEETVLESIEAWQTSAVVSLDAPAFTSGSGTSDGSTTMMDQLGSNDTEMTLLNRVTLRQAMTHLPRREQRIVFLRFYRGLSQAEIATRLNLSQMHISRLLNQALSKLRQVIDQP